MSTKNLLLARARKALDDALSSPEEPIRAKRLRERAYDYYILARELASDVGENMPPFDTWAARESEAA